MSRCFPFPPPGYEKKSTLEDIGLKIEENHKKRKHKEKKGKDKKEKKERKEKERSVGEHKEDKDRKKKKHRDKKDKKKDKRKCPAEKDIVNSSENQNSQKLTPNDKSSDGIQDRKILIELGKRVRNDDKASSSQILHKIPLVEQRKTHLFGKVEGNSDGMLANIQSYKVQSKVLENGLVEKDSCRVERFELGKRFKKDDDSNGSQMLHKITFGEQKKAYLLGKEKENGGGMLADGQSLEVQLRGLGNGSVGDFNGEKQRKIENSSGHMEKVELGKRVRKDDDANGSQQLYKITFGEERKANLPGKKEENGGGMLANGQSLKVQSRGWRNGSVGDFNGEKQQKVENGSGQMEKVVLETRVGKDDEANGSQMLHKITFGEQKKAYLLGKEKENGGGMLSNGQSLKVQSKQQKVEVSSGQMEKVEFVKKVRNNDEATGSQISHNLLGKLGESGGGMLVNGQSLKVQSRGLGNGSVEIFNEEDQRKVENGSSQVEKVEKRKKDMEKRTHKNGECNGDGEKNDDGDKKNKAEEKKRKKEKKEKKERKKEKKMETKDKKKDRSKDKIKERQKDGVFVDFSNNKPLDILNENLECNGILPKSKEFELNGLSHNFGNNKPSADVLKDSHGNLSKRKETEMNSFLHGNMIRPSEISRLATSHQNGNDVVEEVNGKLDEPSRPISISSKPDMNNNVANLALRQNGNDIVEKVNGKLVEPSRPISISSRPNICNNVANLASSTREERQNGNGVVEKVNGKLVESSRPISISSNPNINNNVASNSHVSSNVLDKKREPCETTQRSTRPPPINKAVIDEGANVTHKMDNKVPMMNGKLVDKDNSARLPSVSMKVKEKIDKSVKHPHPDLKYLSQIINVPKVENLQFDDQEWLFGCMDSRSKRAKLDSTEIELTKSVWAESIHIESADVTALPYVIPY